MREIFTGYASGEPCRDSRRPEQARDSCGKGRGMGVNGCAGLLNPAVRGDQRYTMGRK